jgi:hypothetical protein
VTKRLWRTAAGQPAGSRLRRWIATRVFASGWAATDQRDWEYLEQFYDPDVVAVGGEGMPLDWGTTHGWPETRTRLEQVAEVISSDQRPVEAMDLGGPLFAVRVDTKLTGEASGIAVTKEITYLYEISDEGRVVRQWSGTDPDEMDGWLAELT